MRIADVRVLSQSHSIALVEVQTDDGLTGIGVTQSPANVIAAIIEEGAGGLRNMVLGEDPQDTGRLWRKMFVEWGAQRGRGAAGGLAVNAMAAIDMALWDIVGKAQGLPLYKVLGGAVQPQVMVYASATAFDLNTTMPGSVWRHKSTDALVQESKTYVEQGFKAIKYGWGNHFDPEDEEKLAAIREAIGPEVRLMLDFGCPAYWTPGWTVKQAIQAARTVEPYDLYFLEEMLPPYDVEGFAALTGAVDVQIASGESLCTTYECQRFIDGRALDIIQADAAQMGITQVYQVARSAEAAGILCIPHSPWSAPIVSSHLHILSTVPNGPIIEYPAYASFEEGSRRQKIVRMYHEAIVEEQLVIKDGFLQLPTSPGLGLGGFVPEAIAELEALVGEGDER